ncbi:peptide/nickel transport system substrate-binding protein [Bartonella sp. CDC_skunk]|uniref:ABC transporter substrate-binding protein n=1 Tax=unclassified Bartonella TaxID=2645622 RepID=UPI000999B3DE|nr:MULTISPECIES: ABC transporter substrate-binding protein [unclassified Bartonella]AQX21777.1 peptide/nickel transport system substrate-binding protein [Bartonella sp. CDC_skunk]AQX27042.1 peptide/nickel transport system substrate-binding protein [Bartonella sp. Raccoon60]
MNMKKNILKASCFFVSVLVSISVFEQKTLAKTPVDTFVMAWNLDAIKTFDPAQINDVYSHEIILNICSSLADSSPNDATKIIPSLAKSWDVSGENNTVITFHLRDDLKFSDGRSASAHDFVWSMKRIVELDMAGATAFKEYGITKQTVDDAIQALDEKTVVMKFDKPYPAELILNSIAANRVALLLDRETILKHEKNGDMGSQYLATHSACVGPYQLIDWRAGEAVLLGANPHYWGEKPKLKKILIRHVAEPSTQRLLLEKRDVDVARDLTVDILEDLQEKTDVKVEKVLQSAMFYWGFNMTHPILSNEKVRLALRYLIDYEGLGKTVLKGTGIPRASFMPIGSLGALNEKEGLPFKLDLEKAKQLLTEAGYPNGFEISVLIGASNSLQIVQSIQDNAAKVGIRLNIKHLAGTQLFSKAYARAFETIILGWNSESVDPHTTASRIVFNPDNQFESKNTAYPSWQHGYFDEEMNQKVQDALFEKDQTKRAQRYVDLQNEFMQKGPYAFLYQKYNVVAISPVIKKWSWNSAPRIFYHTIEK